jgi:hypothetical protein
VLRHISSSCIDQELAFQEFGDFDHGVVILSRGFPELAGINGYSRIDVVMQGQDMTFVQEVPHETIEIICLLGEFNIQVVGEDISDFIKSFKAAIIVYDSFCATEIGAEGQGAHSVGILNVYNRGYIVQFYGYTML